MKRTKPVLLAIFLLVLAALACNAALPQTASTSAPTLSPTENLIPTQITETVPTQPPGNLPENDAQVPRVPVDQAKAAFERGDAVIVDVRGADAYAREHIVG